MRLLFNRQLTKVIYVVVVEPECVQGGHLRQDDVRGDSVVVQHKRLQVRVMLQETQVSVASVKG